MVKFPLNLNRHDEVRFWHQIEMVRFHLELNGIRVRFRLKLNRNGQIPFKIEMKWSDYLQN